jgi:serine protease
MQMKRQRNFLANVRHIPVMLFLTIAACGGGSGNDVASSPQMNAADSAEVAAAASAVAAPEGSSPQISAKVSAGALKTDSLTDRFIVKYKSNTDEGSTPAAVQRKLDRIAAVLPSRPHHFRRMGVGADIVTTDRKLNANDAKAFMRGIASDPDVEYVEPDSEMSAQLVPNDPLYGDQWHLHSNLAPTTTPNDPGIRAPGAWDLSTGAGQVIAVVDNGVTAHSDLSANLLNGYDFVSTNRGGNGFNPGIINESCTVSWHGTHVAGVAAASTNNGVGVAGVAPNARVLPVRVLNACGTGFMSDVADGITWAAGGQISGVPVTATPAKIINVSVSNWLACSQTLQTAIDYATKQGAVVVAAAGNSGVDVSQWQPGSCRNVIAVGGTDRLGENWGWSNTGPGIDIAAPANSIWSTWNNGTSKPGGDAYAQMDGTSAAAPQISGILALVNAVAPKALSVAELRALLQQNVQPFTTKPSAAVGPGIADATQTVAAAKAGTIPAAADFSCDPPADFMQLRCTDLSTARGGVPIKTWAWNFGDVPNAADMVRTMSVNPTISEQFPGTYTVRLTVTDANGATSTVARPVTVKPPTNVLWINPNTPTPVTPNGSDLAFFRITLPAGLKSVTATVSYSNAGDGGFLYLKNSPSTTSPDCNTRTASQSSMSCTTSNPPAGDYYAIVSSSATSGKLTFTYQ